MFTEVFTVVCALLGIIGLIFLAFYAQRWLHKRFNSGSFGMGQKAVKIVECVSIAQDKQLMIVTAGRKNMLIGVTPNAVTKICDLDEEDLPPEESSDTPAAPYGSAFMKSLKKAFSEKNRGEVNNAEEDLRNEKDDF